MTPYVSSRLKKFQNHHQSSNSIIDYSNSKYINRNYTNKLEPYCRSDIYTGLLSYHIDLSMNYHLIKSFIIFSLVYHLSYFFFKNYR